MIVRVTTAFEAGKQIPWREGFIFVEAKHGEAPSGRKVGLQLQRLAGWSGCCWGYRLSEVTWSEHGPGKGLPLRDRGKEEKEQCV